MKKLIFCFLIVLVAMACTEKFNLEGRWAMDIEGSDDSFIKLADDTIVSPELRFGRDTIYMDIRNNNHIVKSNCIGIYSIEGDKLEMTGSYGDKRICKINYEKDMLIITDYREPDKIIMRLRRIK